MVTGMMPEVRFAQATGRVTGWFRLVTAKKLG